jgi:hypothetical protein
MDVLVALTETLTFCSPSDVRYASSVRVINLPRRSKQTHQSVRVCVCVRAVVWIDKLKRPTSELIYST